MPAGFSTRSATRSPSCSSTRQKSWTERPAAASLLRRAARFDPFRHLLDGVGNPFDAHLLETPAPALPFTALEKTGCAFVRRGHHQVVLPRRRPVAPVRGPVQGDRGDPHGGGDVRGGAVHAGV